MTTGDRHRESIFLTARGCVGCPFRHQGQDPVRGLDCVGLIVHVARARGLAAFDRLDYREIPEKAALPRELEVGARGLICQGVKFNPSLLTRNAIADSGPVPGQLVTPLAESLFLPLDMPAIVGDDIRAPVLFWGAAAGAGKWPGAALMLSRDNDATYSQLDHTPVPLVSGQVETVLDAGLRAYWAQGNLTLFWVRRSRVGGDWQDHTDVPLGELYEKYDVGILDGVTVVRTIAATAPQALYPASLQVADFGAVQSALTIRICQISDTVGCGWPATRTL